MTELYNSLTPEQKILVDAKATEIAEQLKDVINKMIDKDFIQEDYRKATLEVIMQYCEYPGADVVAIADEIDKDKINVVVTIK